MIHAVVALLLLGSGSVPTAESFAACNAEARDSLKSRGSDSAAASPNTKDHQAADDARRGDANRAEDPQLTGMDPEGAKNPTYQAAYRTCMRKSGF
jgi:hypothetical protein